jgi:hypothetical protein
VGLVVFGVITKTTGYNVGKEVTGGFPLVRI